MSVNAMDLNTGYRNLAASIIESGIEHEDYKFLRSPWCMWLCDALDIAFDAVAVAERLRTHKYRRSNGKASRWYCRRCGKPVMGGGRDVLTRPCSCLTWFK